MTIRRRKKRRSKREGKRKRKRVEEKGLTATFIRSVSKVTNIIMINEVSKIVCIF